MGADRYYAERADAEANYGRVCAALRDVYRATLPAGTIRASEIERIADKWNVPRRVLTGASE